MAKKLSKEELITAILECKSNTFKHTHLRDKKNVELEQILFELQDKDLALEAEKTATPVEPTTELVEAVAEVETAKADPKVEPQPSTEKTVEKPVVEESKSVAKPVAAAKNIVNEVTLQIAKPHYYHLRNKGGKVRVTNLGGGDAYVGIEKVTHGDKNARIISGSVKEFENVAILACFATSQPRLKIEEL